MSTDLPQRVLAVGDVVRLRDDDLWGTVIEVCYKWSHDGARVLWTGSGEIMWAPLNCLSLMYSPNCLSDMWSEETERSVDERSLKK